MNATTTAPSGYLHDILDQPAALSATLAALTEFQFTRMTGEFRHCGFKRVVLTGMGSSYHAFHPMYLQLIHSGIPVGMVETSELIYYQQPLLDPSTLVVCQSQSGRSAETRRLLDLAAARQVKVVGVTNTAGSPLQTRAAACLLTRAGDEFSVSCKTYLAGLMALSWLADSLCGNDLEKTRLELGEASAAVASYLQNWQNHIAALQDELKGVTSLFYAGRGASQAAAGTAGLTTKESTHTPAEGMSSAAFRHGPMEMLGAGMYLVVFAGEGEGEALNRRLVADFKNNGGRAALVEGGPLDSPFHIPPAPSRLLPLLEMLPAQMITLALGALHGRTPGVFDHGSKVTTTE